MREFAAFDRKGRLLWSSANYSTEEVLGSFAWQWCEGEAAQSIQNAVGKALIGIPSTTKVHAKFGRDEFEFVTQWYPTDLHEIGVFAIWEAIPSSISRLTVPERTVAYWVGLGLSRKAIATALKLSPSTIDTHKLHIREKVGLDSDGLIRWCVENRDLLARPKDSP
jgi:DNA-binding CsgD family transcriptional regulator